MLLKFHYFIDISNNLLKFRTIFKIIYKSMYPNILGFNILIKNFQFCIPIINCILNFMILFDKKNLKNG